MCKAEWQTGRNIPSSGLLNEWLQQLGLGNGEARSPKLSGSPIPSP